MRIPISLASLVTLSAIACEGPTGPAGPPGPPGGIDPNAAPIDKAYAGAGGKDALLALTGFRVTSDGERLLSLEGYLPGDDAVPVSTFSAETAADVAGDRLRLDVDRTIPLFGIERTFTVLLAGDVGVIDGVESAFGIPGGDLPSDRWASVRRQHRLLHPQLILADVARGALAVADGGVALVDGVVHHRIVVAEPEVPLALLVDPRTGELDRIESVENDHVLGDSEVAVDYLGWRAHDGDVRFPTDVVITAGGQLAHVERRTAVVTDPALDDALFAFPAGAAPVHAAAAAARGLRNHDFLEGFAALGVNLEGLQVAVQAEALAPGVWHLTGGTHHSLAIEQSAGVVIVEAPLYEARAAAVLDWVAATIGKPVTHVIATHHHRDHTGALRTFVARGATIVVGDAARPFFAHAFRAGKTVEPDELAAAPRPATIRGVPAGGSIVLPDALRPVAAHAIESGHAADLLVAHVPGPDVLFVSDIFSPGLGPNPYGARELLAGIDAHGLAITAIAGGHGFGTATRADVEAAAGP
jgi:glyoxylase-like metal-dependent hydrolase (beta-lactamase superfamily II)